MSLEDRIAAIEARLARLERLLSAPTSPALAPSLPVPKSMVPLAKKYENPPEISSYEVQAERSSSVTNFLGWSGATALVLACIYLVGLAVDSGWLTPLRQLMLANLFGLVCVGVGLWLKNTDRRYASLLPAAGIVILFLTIYAAHNYYHFISVAPATVSIIAICLLSLWLCRLFHSDLYALFAVLGSYTAPVFIGGSDYAIWDLVTYFAFWSVLFSVFSIMVERRSVYTLAMYLALVIFHAQWMAIAPDAWVVALWFQTIHLLIFAVAASMYSMRVEPMGEGSAVVHFPALLIFYVLQYHILERHVPEIAPWVAVASAMFLLACYAVVRRVVGHDIEAGRNLLSCYVALVLLHAGYAESVPTEWAPWIGLVVIPIVAVYAMLRGDMRAPGKPLWFAVIAIFVFNYLKLVPSLLHVENQNIVGYDILGLVYAVELYVGYCLSKRSNAGNHGLAALALYAGHVVLMTWLVDTLTSRIVVSIAWGVIALGCLLLSLQMHNKVLGQSSLLIFGASIAKVLFYDITDATALVRIVSLIVLGVSLYLGGWLYKKVNALEESTT